MAAIKKKHLDRREWFTDSDRGFACRYHKDEVFRGGIGLITFTGLKKPEIVDTPEGLLCIADNGYQWLEIVPEAGHFAVTAMFHNDDLLLDVVVLGDGTPQIVDAEELEEALSGGIITRDEYDLARQAADQVVETWNSHKTQIRKKLYEYRELISTESPGSDTDL